jgi:outer membrane protein OmpA-like peptidoglycan-associated protein
MRRIDVRSPDAWRRLDFWSGLIALLFPLALAGMWAAGFRPPVGTCCGNPAEGIAGIASRAPAIALPGILGRKLVSDCNTITAGAEIEFAVGSAELTEDGKAVLDSVTKCLTTGAWEVAGHTDSQGSADANQALSQRRAAAAVEYLTSKRPGAVTMQAIGKGQTEPVADNDTPEGRAKNRRITFKRTS